MRFCLSRRWTCFRPDLIEVGCIAAILQVSVLLLQIAKPLQIRNGALHGGAGELQIGDNGLDARPAFASGVRAVAGIPRGQQTRHGASAPL